MRENYWLAARVQARIFTIYDLRATGFSNAFDDFKIVGLKFGLDDFRLAIHAIGS
jgi:hypothetical protein